jgi:hypothetical protein
MFIVCKLCDSRLHHTKNEDYIHTSQDLLGKVVKNIFGEETNFHIVVSVDKFTIRQFQYDKITFMSLGPSESIVRFIPHNSGFIKQGDSLFYTCNGSKYYFGEVI